MHLLDVLYKLWPIFCGVVAVAVVWWRTRSLFFIVHQILKWLGLEGKYTNTDDQKVADEYLDLNKFNLKTGFHLQSGKAKSKLHNWMRTYDLEFAELRRAGGYFKANKLRFEIPDRWEVLVTRTLYVILAVAFIVGGQFVQKSDYALLKVNATGTWFWVGNHEAYSLRFDLPVWLRGEPWHLQQGDCLYIDAPHPVRDIWDKDVICRLVLGFNDGFIAEAIDSQTNSAWILRVFGAGLFIFVAMSWYRLLRAKEMQTWVDRASSTANSTNQAYPMSEPEPHPDMTVGSVSREQSSQAKSL